MDKEKLIEYIKGEFKSFNDKLDEILSDKK